MTQTSKSCSTCKYCVEDYTTDTQGFVECKNENSLMYCTTLSDIFDGTHPNWGCNVWEVDSKITKSKDNES